MPASAGVRAMHINPDGSGWVSDYEPPANVTPHQLYAQLKAAGVADLVDPSQAALDPGQCYYNTAFATPGGICPPVTWTYLGHPRPVVYFRDFTGAAWPVHSATNTWNQSSVIDSIYVGSNPCPGVEHCVPVYEVNIAATWCGRTYRSWDANRHFIDGYVYSQLNDYNDSNCLGGHLATACHEEGHALGLDHNLSTTSCLYADSVAGKSSVPNSDDYTVLSTISY